MLLKNKRFLPLFITQFFGAFNDNMLKTAIMAFITYNLTLNREMCIRDRHDIHELLLLLPFLCNQH